MLFFSDFYLFNLIYLPLSLSLVIDNKREQLVSQYYSNLLLFIITCSNLNHNYFLKLKKVSQILKDKWTTKNPKDSKRTSKARLNHNTSKVTTAES